MSHPHQALLEEFQIAIDHFVPTVPDVIKRNAQERHDALLADLGATEQVIQEAMYETGLQEYPHRRAFLERTQTMVEEKRLAIVLDHVDETVRAKLKEHLDNGVPLEEIVRSSLFDTEFTGEQRYQVEDAILDAEEHVREEMGDAQKENPEAYTTLVKMWEHVRDKMIQDIAVLEALKEKDPKWRDEIAERVKRFREGFLITEPDPDPLEIEKEIEYWHGTLGEEG